MRLNELAKEAHIQADKNGFWNKDTIPTDVRDVLIALLLINGEVNEAVEVLRKDQGIDRLHEELADIMIRLLDLMGYVNMDVDSIVSKKMEYNKTRPYKHGRIF